MRLMIFTIIHLHVMDYKPYFVGGVFIFSGSDTTLDQFHAGCLVCVCVVWCVCCPSDGAGSTSGPINTTRAAPH